MRPTLAIVLSLICSQLIAGPIYDEFITQKKSGSTILEVLPGARVYVYDRGATVSSSTGSPGTSIPVYSTGSIETGDTVSINGYTATVTDVPDTTHVTVGTALSFVQGDRVLRTSAQVSLYRDSESTSAMTQPLTASSVGRVTFYPSETDSGMFDVLATSTSGARSVFPDRSAGAAYGGDGILGTLRITGEMDPATRYGSGCGAGTLDLTCGDPDRYTLLVTKDESEPPMFSLAPFDGQDPYQIVMRVGQRAQTTGDSKTLGYFSQVYDFESGTNTEEHQALYGINVYTNGSSTRSLIGVHSMAQSNPGDGNTIGHVISSQGTGYHFGSGKTTLITGASYVATTSTTSTGTSDGLNGVIAKAQIRGDHDTWGIVGLWGIAEDSSTEDPQYAAAVQADQPQTGASDWRDNAILVRARLGVNASSIGFAEYGGSYDIATRLYWNGTDESLEYDTDGTLDDEDPRIDPDWFGAKGLHLWNSARTQEYALTASGGAGVQDVNLADVTGGDASYNFPADGLSLWEASRSSLWLRRTVGPWATLQMQSTDPSYPLHWTISPHDDNSLRIVDEYGTNSTPLIITQTFGNCSVTTATKCEIDGDCPEGETCSGAEYANSLFGFNTNPVYEIDVLRHSTSLRTGPMLRLQRSNADSPAIDLVDSYDTAQTWRIVSDSAENFEIVDLTAEPDVVAFELTKATGEATVAGGKAVAHGTSNTGYGPAAVAIDTNSCTTACTAMGLTCQDGFDFAASSTGCSSTTGTRICQCK